MGASDLSPAGPTRRILTLGGHDFTSRSADRAICDFIVEMAGLPCPRVCLLPTASGDPAEQTARFYNAFGDRKCEPTDLSLFRLGRKPVAVRDHLLSQDLIYVGGGSMVNLLAIWDAHEIGAMMALAWKRGIVLAGQSAGSMCWFEAGITRSSGESRAAAGLGLLPGSLCVHYHGEPDRRDAYLKAVARGMPGGHGLDDYAGLVWEGSTVTESVSARRGSDVYRVTAIDGVATEERLASRDLHPLDRDEIPADIAEFRRATRDRQRAGWLG